jgi:uncharacterized RDD family membrane protein YckC
MSTDWYFVRDGAREGPRPRADVKELLASGELPPGTLVWTAGMENWRPASDTPELAGVIPGAAPPAFPPAPEPRPAEPGADAYGTQSRPDAYDAPTQGVAAAGTGPYPWQRWMARLLDMFWFVLAMSTVLAIAGFAGLESANVAVNVLIMALFVPVEALMLSAFGATPGKRLLRISVTNADGSRLTFGTALERSVQVWVRGMGLGLPLVSLVTMVSSFIRLSNDGRTAWDEKLGLRVTHGEVSPLRLTSVVVFLVLVFAMAIAAGMSADGLTSFESPSTNP